QREATGRGQHIDMALLDVMVGTLANQAMNYLVSGTSPRRMGMAHPNIVPYDGYETADGWVIIAVGNDTQFARLSALIDLPAKPGWATNAGRVADRGAVTQAIAAQLRDWERDALLADLEEQGIPAGPINTVGQALTDPQVAARGMVLNLGEGLRGLRTPIRFSEAELAPGRRSPRLGGDGSAWAGRRELPVDPRDRAAIALRLDPAEPPAEVDVRQPLGRLDQRVRQQVAFRNPRQRKRRGARGPGRHGPARHVHARTVRGEIHEREARSRRKAVVQLLPFAEVRRGLLPQHRGQRGRERPVLRQVR